jgi:hypothetical protein
MFRALYYPLFPGIFVLALQATALKKFLNQFLFSLKIGFFSVVAYSAKDFLAL